MFKLLHKIILATLFAAFASQASAMWIQADTYDPAQPGVGTNRYAYSNNDPVNKLDPNGNSWLDRAWDSIAGEGSFNRTFGDKGSAWSDRNFGNSVEKGIVASRYDSEISDRGFSGTSYSGYADFKQKAIFSASGIAASGDEFVADVALIGSGAGALYKVGRWTYAGISASMNTSRVFWSGVGARTHAEAYAAANGGTTLEMTLTGRILDAVTTPKNFSKLEGLWARASARFAQGAQDATVFQGSANRGVDSVWQRIEQPILDSRGISYVVHLFD
jgi:hypothetical protein